MIKNLVLLLACVPIGLLLWPDVSGMVEGPGIPTSSPVDPAESEKEAAAELEKATETVDSLKEALVGATKVVGKKIPVAPTSASKAEKDAVEAFATHKENLLAARSFLADCANGRTPEATQLPASLAKIWEDSRVAIEEEWAIRALVKLYPAQKEELRRKIEECRARNPALAESVSAEVDWKDLQDVVSEKLLDRLHDRLAEWSIHPDRRELAPNVVDPVRRGREALEKYAKDHPHAVESDHAVRAQLVRWGRTLAIVDLIASPAPPADPLQRISAVAALAQEGLHDEPFAIAARRVTNQLCDEYLPLEPLDPLVIIQKTPGAREEMPRKSVSLSPKDPAKDPIPLRDREDREGIDEFNVPADDIGTVGLGEDTAVPYRRDCLEPTGYSKAVHAFNLRRKEVHAWTATALADLKSICAQKEHADALRMKASTLPDRVEALSRLVQRYPAVFRGPAA